MKTEQEGGIVREAVIGSIIVAVILVIGTFWTGHSAGEDTDDAMSPISFWEVWQERITCCWHWRRQDLKKAPASKP